MIRGGTAAIASGWHRPWRHAEPIPNQEDKERGRSSGLDTSDRGEGTVIGGGIRSATFGAPDQESNADGNADGNADA